MARIRTIKPEFWDSPDVARASLRTRLFYIAMWNWADDYGKGTASAKQLIGFAFPNDEDVTVSDYPSLAKDVAECFGVVFYEADRRPYYFIPTFPDHQRTEKRATSRIPDPPSDVSAGQKPWDGSSDDRVGSSDARRGPSVSGTGEQGNRGKGTGEQGKSEQGNSLALRASAPVVTDDAFELFWDAYGKKVGRGAAEKAWRKACKTADEEDITRAAALHADWHRRAGTEARFIPHPTTWLNEKRWADERTDIDPPRRADGDIDWDAAMQRARARDERNAG